MSAPGALEGLVIATVLGREPAGELEQRLHPGSLPQADGRVPLEHEVLLRRQPLQDAARRPHEGKGTECNTKQESESHSSMKFSSVGSRFKTTPNTRECERNASPPPLPLPPSFTLQTPRSPPSKCAQPAVFITMDGLKLASSCAAGGGGEQSFGAL
eukprot:1196334-Prorocentrum_minimum.AAC.6